jgi:dienelactone hydrolase
MPGGGRKIDQRTVSRGTLGPAASLIARALSKSAGVPSARPRDSGGSTSQVGRLPEGLFGTHERAGGYGMNRRIACFLAAFMRGAPDAKRERELLIGDKAGLRAATVYLPSGRRAPSPAWILLHGVTVPGRHHQALRRMARSLAAAGQLVLVPEAPSWRSLLVQPGDTEPAVRSALAKLDGWPRVDRRKLGLMGFSVSATWALEVASGDLRDRFRTVVGMGAYGNMHSLMEAMVTGRHVLDGTIESYRPDPYGRWIMGANLLPLLDGDGYGSPEARVTAARALHQLADTAGSNGALAGEPVYDPLIRALRATLPADGLRAWDLLAPPSKDLVPDATAGRELAARLADAAIAAHPDLDPAGRLEGLRARVFLLHGRRDHLVPFTETLRLAQQLRATIDARVTITRLVGHTKSREARPPRNPVTLGGELARFVDTMEAIITSIEA